MDMVLQHREYSWIRYLKQRLRQNKNFMGVITGPTGSGKSWSGLSIGEMIDPSFNIDQCVFGGRELMELINSGKVKRGSYILWDETGVGLSSRNWQSLANKVLSFLMQSFRHKNFILLFTTPYEDFVDVSTRKLIHAEFKTISIDFNKKKVKLKPKLYQYNPEMKKFYKKYLRVITKEGVIPITAWNVPKPSDKLVKEYEAKRIAFTKDLNERIQQDLQKFEQKNKRPLTDLQKRIIECWKKGITNHRLIGEELGKQRHQISQNIGFLYRKGHNADIYLPKPEQ